MNFFKLFKRQYDGDLQIYIITTKPLMIIKKYAKSGNHFRMINDVCDGHSLTQAHREHAANPFVKKLTTGGRITEPNARGAVHTR